MKEIMDSMLEARKKFIIEMKKELLGPGSEYPLPDEEHEIITDLPEIRYGVGVLYPQKNRMEVDNDVTTQDKGVLFDQDDLEEGIEQQTINEITEENLNDLPHKNSNINGEDAEMDSLDEQISMSAQLLPSSMGYTFIINKDITSLKCSLSFGTYQNNGVKDCKLPFIPPYEGYSIPAVFEQYIGFNHEENFLYLKTQITKKDVYRIYEMDKTEDGYFIDCVYRLCDQLKKGYHRIPHPDKNNLESFDGTVKIEFIGSMGCEVNIDNQSISIIAVKRCIGEQMYSITIMLSNTAVGNFNGRNSIFQPKLMISSEENAFQFCDYANMDIHGDEEEKSLCLLYRNKKIYATGHGTSTDWQIDRFGVGILWNEFLPIKEVPPMNFDIEDAKISAKAMQMKYLSDLDNSSMKEKIEAMETLINAYDDWVGDIQNKADQLGSDFQSIATSHIKECAMSRDRMRAGLKMLQENKLAFNAFQLTNRAMLMQRIHSNIQANDYYPRDKEHQEKMGNLDYYHAEEFYVNGKEPAWRPFQLAFLLMSITSIVDPEHSERDLVDLIWFPTGGGKTEAYLGLTAFTIFYRKLAHLEESAGTTVIMRYTLRLLASQQFVRAAILICACESIRNDCIKRRSKYPKYPLGKEKISIGLWIGGNHTPNRNSNPSSKNPAEFGASEHVNALKSAGIRDLRELKDKHHKFQILKCPWCGTKLVKDIRENKIIGDWGYEMRDGRSFYMHCTQEYCEFENNLPIQVVDEELYKNPPSLLFGTVDKFAMLPWKSDTGSFFATNSKNRTPELIIQDELHLISGPLGTIVGLYESAIDILCSAKGVKPKIIASTATIRRAKEQCSQLYNRMVKQFPSPGIDAEDSFFAKEAPEKFGRLYLGIMPSGKTKAMMEVRTIASILQRVYMLDNDYFIKDKFWTLSVYFNSLRDLGKCSTLIDDDVKDFIHRLGYRFGRRNNVRQIGAASELTSRVSTTQLNETLDRLEHLEYSEKNQAEKKYPISVLLATNMISVGVDVARLNVMLLVGQPKLTSEYIQASSRIGRTFPGSALVLYDGSKSRDRSHYEQFKAYHESFYRFVEPTGVTPFSKPARDRGLHAVIVALIRHLYGLNKDSDAASFDITSKYIKEIEEVLLKRVSDINERLSYDFEDNTPEILQEMEDFFSEWQERLDLGSKEHFYYGDQFMVKSPTGVKKRLMKVYSSGGDDNARETLMSMRNVDQNIAANIIIWED